MNKSVHKYGFTLVELVVVIVIVWILSTVGFISYSGYIAGARDSNRMAQMVKMSDSLQFHATKSKLPFPDDYIEIKAGSKIIAYQGYVGANVLDTINYTNGGKDPLDDTYLTYTLSKNRKKIQLLSYMEEEDSITHVVTEGYAADYQERYPVVYGSKIGTLTVKTLNTPIQEVEALKTAGELDIVATTDEYTAHITSVDTITWNGTALVASIPNESCARIKQMWNSHGNGTYIINPGGTGEVETYCTMDTASSGGGGWSQWRDLADSNCLEDDIVSWGITMAWCNSTFKDIHYAFSGSEMFLWEIGNCIWFTCPAASAITYTSTLNDFSSGLNDYIFWEQYTEAEKSQACPAWWKLPSVQDYCDILTGLWYSISSCTWAQWSASIVDSNGDLNYTDDLVESLKIPKVGHSGQWAYRFSLNYGVWVHISNAPISNGSYVYYALAFGWAWTSSQPWSRNTAWTASNIRKPARCVKD